MVNFQIVIPNKLYRSGKILQNDIRILTGSDYNVRKIISLDLAIGREISKYIPAGVEHIMYPIELGGNPTAQARGLSGLIRNNVFDAKNGATLVHCERGIDRTGLAIALYRGIKQQWDCKKVFNEADSKGYGSGLTPAVKKAFDYEICRNCSGDYCKTFEIVDGNLKTEIQQANDGFILAESIPPAFNPQQSFSVPLDPTTNYYPGYVRSSLETRKKLLKKILNILENNDDEQNLDVGLIDNFDGIPNSGYTATSGTLDIPNAAGLIGSGNSIK